MARLVLVFNKKVIKDCPFDKENMTIGRDEGNDIVIDNLAVSGFHARIDKTGDNYILTDLQSTNGTWVWTIIRTTIQTAKRHKMNTWN